MANCRVLILILLCAVSAAPVPLWAQNRDHRLRSSDDLDKSFQVLKGTVDRLVLANAQWAQDNRSVGQNIQELKDRQQAMTKGAELLARDLADWDEKTKSKTALRGEAKNKEDEIKAQLASADQEITIKKEQLEVKEKEQERIWERLAVVGTDEGQWHNVKDLRAYALEEKELVARLEESRAQKKQLEQMLDYWTLLNADPSFSVSKLMVQRDVLIKRRNLLTGQASRNPRKLFSYQDMASQERLKKLDFEVKQLTQKRFESSKLLQIIENQYNSAPSASRSSDEKKIQASMIDLKKDNKLLKEQLANLRFEMVSLDKKRAQLEREVGLAK